MCAHVTQAAAGPTPQTWRLHALACQALAPPPVTLNHLRRRLRTTRPRLPHAHARPHTINHHPAPPLEMCSGQHAALGSIRYMPADQRPVRTSRPPALHPPPPPRPRPRAFVSRLRLSGAGGCSRSSCCRPSSNTRFEVLLEGRHQPVKRRELLGDAGHLRGDHHHAQRAIHTVRT